jgi:hypothetical protein
LKNIDNGFEVLLIFKEPVDPLMIQLKVAMDFEGEVL